MSEKFHIEAVLHFPKVVSEDGKPPKFQAMFLLKEAAVKRLNEVLAPYQMVNKKAKTKVKELDRTKFNNIPREYTHSLNMGSRVEWLDVTDVRGNKIDVSSLGFGDHVYALCKPAVTSKPTGEKYLGAFVNNIALIKANAVDTSGKDPEVDSFLNKLKSFIVEEEEAIAI